jgi:glutamyl-tRNA synthetase
VAPGGQVASGIDRVEDVTEAPVRTRFAPSPTGELHLGGAWTALASWVVARRVGGAAALRIEDLDSARVNPQSEQAIMRDLRWLGLDWDEDPVRQSARGARYEEAIALLARQGLVYPCDCSRAEIARAVAAPHPGEEVVYPGVCRHQNPARPLKRSPAWRVVVPSEVVSYDDGVAGAISQRLDRDVGDFVLKRGDGAFAYQLAVVVDDLAMGITDVLRGADLVTSTPRQIWLAGALGGRPPRYAHVPLVLADRHGARLEKRTLGASIRELREAGVGAEQIVGELAHGLGLATHSGPTTPAAVAASYRERNPMFRREPWAVPEAWQALVRAARGDDLG